VNLVVITILRYPVKLNLFFRKIQITAINGQLKYRRGLGICSNYIWTYNSKIVVAVALTGRRPME